MPVLYERPGVLILFHVWLPSQIDGRGLPCPFLPGATMRETNAMAWNMLALWQPPITTHEVALDPRQWWPASVTDCGKLRLARRSCQYPGSRRRLARMRRIVEQLPALPIPAILDLGGGITEENRFEKKGLSCQR